MNGGIIIRESGCQEQPLFNENDFVIMMTIVSSFRHIGFRAEIPEYCSTHMACSFTVNASGWENNVSNFLLECRSNLTLIYV